MIRSVDALDLTICEILCYGEPDCVSFNFKKSVSQCELNNSTFEEQKDKLETNNDYIYRGAEVSEELQIWLQIYNLLRNICELKDQNIHDGLCARQRMMATFIRTKETGKDYWK